MTRTYEQIDIESLKVALENLKKQKKRTLEFSKILALVVTVMFVLTWAMAWVSWFVKNEVPEVLLTYVSVQFGVVISGYLTKSAIENREKIKTPNEILHRVSEDNR